MQADRGWYGAVRRSSTKRNGPAAAAGGDAGHETGPGNPYPTASLYHWPVNPDDHVCLCFRVSQRKLVTFLRREKPRVASQLSECLGAGTGCQWCVPYLCRLFEQWEQGCDPALDESPEAYARQRSAYRAAIRSNRMSDETDTSPDTPGSEEPPLPPAQ